MNCLFLFDCTEMHQKCNKTWPSIVTSIVTSIVRPLYVHCTSIVVPMGKSMFWVSDARAAWHAFEGTTKALLYVVAGGPDGGQTFRARRLSSAISQVRLSRWLSSRQPGIRYYFRASALASICIPGDVTPSGSPNFLIQSGPSLANVCCSLSGVQ